MKLLVLASAAVVSLPPQASAADSPATLYGTLNVSADNVKVEGSTSPGDNLTSRNRVTSNSSAFGVRGAEPLDGNGLSAIFQIESGVAMDTGTASTSTGTPATRNSNLGLSGNLGTIFFGSWNTPYKSTTASSIIDAFYAVGMPYYADVISGNSTPTTPNAANRNAFDRRQNNVVQYWTPNWKGLSGRFGYSPNETRTSDGAAIQQNPNLYSVSATYSQELFYLSLAYEKHDQFANTATVRTDDQGIKLSAAYTFGSATTLALIYEQLKFDGNVGATGGIGGVGAGGDPTAVSFHVRHTF